MTAGWRGPGLARRCIGPLWAHRCEESVVGVHGEEPEGSPVVHRLTLIFLVLAANLREHAAEGAPPPPPAPPGRRARPRGGGGAAGARPRLRPARHACVSPHALTSVKAHAQLALRHPICHTPRGRAPWPWGGRVTLNGTGPRAADRVRPPDSRLVGHSHVIRVMPDCRVDIVKSHFL